ncbi:nitrite reductase small subunit NirD [Maribacter luteus]|uniref:Nitrite reductase small subunit NirD n=1 Tax=Maribacter luteus TaxID=2594478 RepID=A0A6I2MLH7_9FLAO|nr:nitrite reductase small subunit NirD [Maribacter luteus]MRX63637.1 nitrite reductase small subunit NirD [Maribacter luteus]|tara:strand:- start:349 stop:726 length:378 start_codon:yes stop_codon:yes gene_type:complete
MISSLKTYETVTTEKVKVWFKAAPTSRFPKNGGACIKYKDKQIAVFNFAREGRWYACQNLCPHKMEMVLSRGIIGEENMEPKVACPLHKNTFSLKNGNHLNGDLEAIATYPVKVEDDIVYVGFSE